MFAPSDRNKIEFVFGANNVQNDSIFISSCKQYHSIMVAIKNNIIL